MSSYGAPSRGSTAAGRRPKYRARGGGGGGAASPAAASSAASAKGSSGGDGDGEAPLNIMCDPRVVRGKTRGVPMRRGEASAASAASAASPGRRGPRRAKPQWRQTVAEIHDSIHIAPRTRTEVPLHLYLEEQAEPVAVAVASSQTDRFASEPEERPYVPPKSGIDAGTQVETARVFDFDRDVDELLECLVGKTLDQSLMEVSEEEELASARRHRARLERQLELERGRREQLERAEVERFAAKERVLADARVRDAERRVTERKLAAKSFARQYLATLQGRVLGRLEEAGHFYDPVQRQVEEYMPELATEVVGGVETVRSARRLVDMLLGSATERTLAESDQARASRDREERKKRMSIQLHVHCPMFGDQPVGPLRLRALATIREVEQEVGNWVDANMDKSQRFSNYRFTLGSNDEPLGHDAVLYDIGIENLGDLRLHLERTTVPVDDGNGEDEDDE